MRKLFKRLVLLGSIASLCSLWASDTVDVQEYSINISVIDEKNQPIRNATVEIRLNGKTH